MKLQDYESPTTTVVWYTPEGVVLYSSVENMEDNSVFDEFLDNDFIFDLL